MLELERADVEHLSEVVYVQKLEFSWLKHECGNTVVSGYLTTWRKCFGNQEIIAAIIWSKLFIISHAYLGDKH